MHHIAYIGIGSNLGNRDHNCREAIRLIGLKKSIEVEKISAFYETEAVLDAGAPPQPKYLNAALKISTSLPPEKLLLALQDVEIALGRLKERPKSSPRTIDLDILFYDDIILDLPSLKIPHPEVQKRMFVLIPLCDIAPALVYPKTGKTIKELKDILSP